MIPPTSAAGTGTGAGAGLTLTVSDLIVIDETCDRFEADWRGGARPDLAAFLTDASEAARPRLFRDLLTIELEARLELGETPTATDYQERFPDDADAIAAAFVLFSTDGSTLASPTMRGKKDQAHAEMSPAVVAALRAEGYEVHGELGRGGMGVVYLARKVALNRFCALKMILAGAFAGSAASARFRAEAETVARLRHADIVQIYHVGEADGLPYLELEYLPGGSLDRVLDGTPMPAGTAARLVKTLALAIAEAHRQGIVHRDLKPANILLDAAGQPKVTDFGLAKILDADGELTRSKVVIGSPCYMAPEQADAGTQSVGAATDVYALGAVLYELLTGRPPFRAATALETIAQVKTIDPVPPSRFQPALPRDLETICLRCLEKAPARRFSSAEALAEDLRRFLDGETILARPTAWWERAWKWSLRRPAIAAAVAVGAVAVVLLLGGAFYYNTHLKAALAKARKAESEAVRQRNLAQKALNQLIFSVQENLGDAPETRPIRQKLLNMAIHGLDELAQSTESFAPDLPNAIAHQKLGDIFQQVGRTADARRQYEISLRLAEGLAAASPRDIETAVCLSQTCFKLGKLEVDTRHLSEAKRYLHRAMDTAKVLGELDPRHDWARRGLIESTLQIGRAHGFSYSFGSVKELAEAERWLIQSRDLAARWVDDEPRDNRVKDLLASCDRKLADVRKLGGQHEAARADYHKAIEIGERLVAAEPGNPGFKYNLAKALDDLAGLESQQHAFAEARPHFEKAVRLLTELVEFDPDDQEIQLWLVRVQVRFARLDRDESRFGDAAETAHAALERLLRVREKDRLEGRPPSQASLIPILRQEIADYDEAPAALAPLESITSRPIQQAIPLLRIRARLLGLQGHRPEALATIEALRDLDAAASAADLAEQGLALCLALNDLETSRPIGTGIGTGTADDLAGLRPGCLDRSMALLNRAVDLGFRDPDRFQNDPALARLRDHAGFASFLAHQKAATAPNGGR